LRIAQSVDFDVEAILWRYGLIRIGENRPVTGVY
jgi:hypothetical protein